MTSQYKLAVKFLKQSHTKTLTLIERQRKDGAVYYVIAKKCLRNRLRHYLHPTYLYCRLCDKIHNRKRACKICKWYEAYVWRWMKKLIELLPY